MDEYVLVPEDRAEWMRGGTDGEWVECSDTGMTWITSSDQTKEEHA